MSKYFDELFMIQELIVLTMALMYNNNNNNNNNTPGIYKFCHLAYSQPSILAFGDRTVRSEEGPQQGDPLGAALFCETIQPMLSSLSSALEIGYMDDLTLGGDEQQVCRPNRESRNTIAAKCSGHAF